MNVRPLARADAPGLFALVEGLDVDDISVDGTAELKLVERGGVVGIGARRELVVGVPLLALLDAAELRALVARASARTGLRVGRSRERAANAFAVSKTSAPSLASGLAKRAVGQRLFRLYVQSSVALAIEHGAMPADPIAGFERSLLRYDARGVTRGLLETIRSADPDALLADARVTLPATNTLGLLGFDHETWVAHALQETRLPLVPWAELPATILAPSLVARSRTLAARLVEIAPEPAFATLHAALAAGRAMEVATALEPRLGSLPTDRAAPLVPETIAGPLALLFTGALLERGATFVAVLGEESPVLTFENEIVAPRMAVLAALADGAAVPALAEWAARLA